MFIKHGDGKIMSVVEEEELTDAQKKAAKDLSSKAVKTGETTSDAAPSGKSSRSN